MAAPFPMFAANHGHSLQSGEALAPAAQGAALFMTVIVAGILLSLAVGIWVLVRRARRGETPEHALLREIREESRRNQKNEPPPEHGQDSAPERSPQTWEKDADWWKTKPGPDHRPPAGPES